MLPQGSFQCALCEERHHVNKKNEEYRSYMPERKILVCDFCIDDYRNSMEYEHLRPDIDPGERENVEKKREYYKESHVYF